MDKISNILRELSKINPWVSGVYPDFTEQEITVRLNGGCIPSLTFHEISLMTKVFARYDVITEPLQVEKYPNHLTLIFKTL